MTGPRPTTALFIARAWYEDDQFRARVSRCIDLDTEAQTEQLTGDPEQLIDYLRSWLRDLARPTAADHDPSPDHT